MNTAGLTVHAKAPACALVVRRGEICQTRHSLLVVSAEVRVPLCQRLVVLRDRSRAIIKLVEIIEWRDLSRLGHLSLRYTQVDLGLEGSASLSQDSLTSMISISGTPRPYVTAGPAWSSPGHVHADILCPGRLSEWISSMPGRADSTTHYEMTAPPDPESSAAAGPVPFANV